MRILIADDEIYVRMELNALLKELIPMAIIDQVENGNKLKEILNINNYHIAFIDIKMPGQSGLEVLEDLNIPNTIFIILSGYSDFDFARKAISLGVSEYMVKPVTKKELSEVLKRIKPSLQILEEDHCINNRLIKDAEKIIYRRYTEQIGVAQIAEELNVSPNYLSSMFKKITNKTLTSYITDLRLKTSKEMLSLPGACIKQISLSLGYQSSRHFARLFREKYNCSPSEFMNKG